MIVKCVNDDFSTVYDLVKPILIVGEEMPIKGNYYEVDEEFYFNTKEFKGKSYSLKGLNYSHFGIDLSFKASRFKIVKGDGYQLRMLPETGDIVKSKLICCVYQLKI